MAIHGAQFSAAAEFGTGYIRIDQYEREINDVLRRAGILGQRVSYVPATGALSRWVDQTATGAAAFDTRNALAPVASSPTRSEKSLLIKAITNRVQFGLFDQQVSAIGANWNLKAKDLMDMVNGVIRLRDKSLWQGTDAVAGSQVGDGTTLQYVGIPKQISTTSLIIANGTSVVPVLRKEVARMISDADYALKPSAIYVNPLLHYIIEEELKQASGGNTIAQVELIAGVKVPGVMTAAGLLPLIPDFDLATNPAWATAAPAGETNYPFTVLTEELIEFHYVGSQAPQVFQLGTTSNLQEDYVAVQFGAPVVKLANKAHLRGVVQRTTL